MDRAYRDAPMFQLSSIPEERVGHDKTSPWLWEHRARYLFVEPWIRGKTVVDIACGTGFGASMMLEAGAEIVVGMDLSTNALMAAKRDGNKAILCGADGLRIPLRDGCVDVAVSFETIEHVEVAEEFVAELARVISPRGTLILSTPNALYTKPVDGRPRNPFHVREFTPLELGDLLSGAFSRVELVGQAVDLSFGVSPYWALPEDLPTDLLGRARTISWKLQRRLLPLRAREWLSRALTGHAFYPRETDFVFSGDALDRAHVTVAICGN